MKLDTNEEEHDEATGTSGSKEPADQTTKAAADETNESADQRNELKTYDLLGSMEARDQDQNQQSTLTGGIGTLVPATRASPIVTPQYLVNFQNTFYGMPMTGLPSGYLPPVMEFPNPGTTIYAQLLAMLYQYFFANYMGYSSMDTGGGIRSSSSQVRPVVPSSFMQFPTSGAPMYNPAGFYQPQPLSMRNPPASYNNRRQVRAPHSAGSGVGRRSSRRRRGVGRSTSSGASGSGSQQNLILVDRADGQPAADRQPSPDDERRLWDIQNEENLRMFKLLEDLQADVAKFKNQIKGQSDRKRRRLPRKKLPIRRGSSSRN